MAFVEVAAIAALVGLLGLAVGLAVAPRLAAWDERRARRDGAPSDGPAAGPPAADTDYDGGGPTDDLEESGGGGAAGPDGRA